MFSPPRSRRRRRLASELGVGRSLVAQGHVPPPSPEAPGIFAMADPARIRRLVTAEGFEEPEIEEKAFRWHFVDQDAYWRFLTDIAGGRSLRLGRGGSGFDGARQACRQGRHLVGWGAAAHLGHESAADDDAVGDPGKVTHLGGA